MDLDAAIAAFREAQERGLPFPFRGAGLSMWPLLRPGDVAWFRALEAPPRIGEVLLVRGPGRLHAHRLLGRRDDGRLRLQGDAVPTEDPPVAADEVLGRLVFVQRGGGRAVPADHPLLRAWARLVLDGRRLSPRLYAALGSAAFRLARNGLRSN